MASNQEGKWVVPNPQVPRTFGLLNIIFGILLLLFGVYSIAMLWLGPRLQAAVMSSMKEQEAARKADQDAKLADLKKREAAATTKEEKDAIADERAAVEKRAVPMVSGIMGEAMSMTQDKRIVVYSVVEGTAGIILNIAMLISGIGLMGMSEWGRKLALSVAWLKILRWITVVIVTMVVIVPITTEMMRKMLVEVEKQAKANSGGGTPAMPMAQIGQYMAIGSAVSTVVIALVACIYPIVSLWFLTRPPTRAAMLASKEAGAPPPEFDLGE